ncbi:MAG: ATP-binding protein [Nitriliruptoraceae bacterium]
MGAARRYWPRVVDAVLSERMASSAAVLIEGPKACGKTETASQKAASMVRLDVDEDARQAAQIDPGLILEGARPRLIDEWQLHPQVWDHVRRHADASGQVGQFLLTGSSTPADDVRRHSGAGRIASVRMRPMTLYEIGSSSSEVSLTQLFAGDEPAASSGRTELRDVLDLLVTGGWPQQLQRRDPRFVIDYLDQTTHLDINAVAGADGRQPARRRDPKKVLACIRSLARNVATAASARSIAADTGLSREAVTDYLAALERLMILEEQPAFNVHLRSSRNLRSTPHRHLVDPSLATAALRVDTDGLLRDLNYAGLLFESLVVRDLRVLSQPLEASVMYFRTDHHEIDLVLQRPDGTWGAIEVKLGGEDLIEQGAASLLEAVSSIDLVRAGAPAFMAIVTASGRYAYRRDDGVCVVPLTTLAP